MTTEQTYIDISKEKDKASKFVFTCIGFSIFAALYIIGYCVESFYTQTNFFKYFSIIFILIFMFVFIYANSLLSSLPKEIILKLIDNPQKDIKLTNTIRALYKKNKGVSASDLQPIKRLLHSRINAYLNSRIKGESKLELSDDELDMLKKSLNQINEIMESSNPRLQNR